MAASGSMSRSDTSDVVVLIFVEMVLFLTVYRPTEILYTAVFLTM